jgi:filamentous hemagglutinin family protein
MPPIRRLALRPVPAAVALAVCAAGAAANPQGGVVQAGSARIAPNGNRLDIIQSSQRAVIDWRSFNIAPGGHVNFQQPSAAAATLNRVTGPEMSAILGRLTANGTVFLVNPNGILIGPGAKIDVGGLVAATANISNENFMAGRYKFDEVVNRNAVIVNRGEITAQAGGLVALVAPGVENSGVIRAELGRVVLASGNRFTLDLFGDKLISFAVDDKVAARLTDVDGRPLKAYVNQAGRIEADGGSVLISASAAKAVLDNVINTSGVVRATSFVQRPGEIVLNGGAEGMVRVAGTLDASGRASGASGGTVKMLGAEVVLEAGGRLDVAGDAGGGIALIGGAGRGAVDVARSSRTAIEAGATVVADAITTGNGGTVIAWADGQTRFAGAFSARGGAGGGDGGLVQVAGERGSSFVGTVDVGAPAGRGGRLLLKPEVLVVDARTAAAIASVLRTGVEEFRTVADTIDVRERIDGRGGAAGGGLRLEAGIAIVLNNDIITNDGRVTLIAGAGGIAMSGGPEMPATGRDGTMIHAGTAPITLSAVGNLTTAYLVTTGPVTLTSVAGNVSLNRDLGGGPGAGIGALTVAAGRDVRLRGVRSAGGVAIDTLVAGRTITLDGPIRADGGVTIGTFARRETTTIRLRSDIHSAGGDIELNGLALVNPRASGDEIVILRNPPVPFLTSNDRTMYENALVQVALQTEGTGNVRLNGDVLWDYAAPPENAVRFLYNVPEPYRLFPRDDAGLVGALRAAEPLRPTGYYGLNIKVDRGSVQFGRHLGTLDPYGVSTAISPPDPLGAANPANGLFVTINIGGPSQGIGFNALSNVEVARFRVAPATAAPRDIGTSNLGLLGSRPQKYRVLTNSNLPRVNVEDTNPGLIGPGPRNVNPPEAERFAALPSLPEILVQRDPAPGPGGGPTAGDPAGAGTAAGAATTGATLAGEPAAGESAGGEAAAAGGLAGRVTRDADASTGPPDLAGSADLGRGASRSGVAADAFREGAPLVPLAGEVAGADREYFSHGPFELLDVRLRGAGEGR